jgi:hypothetical protein
MHALKKNAVFAFFKQLTNNLTSWNQKGRDLLHERNPPKIRKKFVLYGNDMIQNNVKHDGQNTSNRNGQALY